MPALFTTRPLSLVCLLTNELLNSILKLAYSPTFPSAKSQLLSKPLRHLIGQLTRNYPIQAPRCADSNQM